MKKKQILACVLAVGCYTGSGCASKEETTVSDTTAAPAVSTANSETSVAEAEETSVPAGEIRISTELESENVYGGYVGLDSTVFSDESGIIYTVSGNVIYYGMVMDGSVVLAPYCSVTGCSHNSTDCPAYIGNASDIALYHDVFYCVIKNESGAPELRVIDPKANQRKTIFTLEHSDTVQEDFASILFSDQTAFASVNKWMIDEQGNQTNTMYTESIDLSTGEAAVLFEDEDNVYYKVRAVKNGKAAVSATTMEENISGEFTSKESLDMYTLSTMESVHVTNSESGFVSYSDSLNKTVGSNVVYARNHEIHLYDMDAMEDTLLAETEDPVINYWILDRKVQYITKNEEEINLYACDIDSGENFRIESKPAGQTLTISVYAETPDGFMGLMNGNTVWISKENYYAGNYDKAIPIKTGA